MAAKPGNIFTLFCNALCSLRPVASCKIRKFRSAEPRIAKLIPFPHTEEFMGTSSLTVPELKLLKDLWDPEVAAKCDEPELLRYRSNLLGADLRITNFGGGNTSSKILENDPVSGASTEVLWVKGSGGDLGSIQRSGFATLFLDKLVSLKSRYRGIAHEDEMVEFYPLCAFGKNSVA